MIETICWECEKPIKKIRYLSLKLDRTSVWYGSAVILCSDCKDEYSNIRKVKEIK